MKKLSLLLLLLLPILIICNPRSSFALLLRSRSASAFLFNDSNTCHPMTLASEKGRRHDCCYDHSFHYHDDGALNKFQFHEMIEDGRIRQILSLCYDSRMGYVPRTIHFCFLMHGYRGLVDDLDYMHGALAKEASNALNDDGKAMVNIVIHRAKCNENQTKDGIVKGGERLMEEVFTVLNTYIEAIPQNIDLEFSLSFIGISLGGLYCRHAIRLIHERLHTSYTLSHSPDESARSLNEIVVQFNCFCSMASPHLGVSGYTFFKIPRSLEKLVAYYMGPTGHDLFCLNNLIQEMATCNAYVSSLTSFKHRIAYANIFQTDFPVPTATAAFLSPRSTYPHSIVSVEDNNLIHLRVESDAVGNSFLNNVDVRHFFKFKHISYCLLQYLSFREGILA